ncbi:ribonuclease H-like domain-containing protein, partial [Tanacetum coccineum]
MTGPTTNELLVKLLAQLGTLGLNNIVPSTPVTYHAGLTPYVGPTTVGPSSGLVYPPGFPSPTKPDATVPIMNTSKATILTHAFTVGTLHDPACDAWNMDTGAGSHLNNPVNSLSEIFNTCMYPSISVGDGHSIPITNTGHSILPMPLKSLHLNNVLITPHIVKNLIYVCQFVCDNNYTIEFDTFGFSIKDFMTRQVLLRCDSTRDLYPITPPSPIPHVFLVSQHTWHQPLGHSGSEVLRRLVSNNFISCNKEKPHVLCHACQLGKHVRLLFVSSNTVITSCFDIIHSDVWTSPIPSLSGFNYHFVLFRTYVCTQFKYEIRSLQCDHGGEFDNRNLHKLFADNDIQFRFSCPKTFQKMLEPRATPSIYLGQASNHRGYRCLDLKTNKIIISRHVTFDETVFPYGSTQPALPPTYTFLDDILDITPPIIPSNPAVQLLHEPITLIHNTKNQAHSPQQLSLDQVQTTKNQAHSPPPSTFAVQQQTPTKTQSSATQHEPVAQSPIIIPDPPENPNSASIHPMVTRLCVMTNRPTARLTLHVSSVSPLPKSYRDAFSDPKWQNAMRDKYHTQGTDTAYLLLYVDDIVPTAFYEVLLQRIIRSLHQEFAMTDLGLLNYFLESTYDNCETSRTLVDTKTKLGVDGDPVSDPTLYRSLAGSLKYLTFTRPDISYVVQLVCLHMHDPREPHLSTLKRILRYVQGTLHYGLQLFSSSTTDADWAGCPTTRRSTSEYYVFLGNNMLSWSSKLQHQRTKHIEIDIHFVRDLVAAGQCEVSESNVRRIQVKDIVKEVEDYLKTYSSAGIDIS